jgi:hypothetical protein
LSSDSEPTAAVPSELRFLDVTLLSPVPGADGATPARGLGFGIDGAGLTLTGDDGSLVWSAAWQEVAELVASEQPAAADGSHGTPHEDPRRRGTLVVVTTRGHHSHRLLVPAIQPEKLTAALTSLARRHDVAAPEGNSPPPLAIAGLIVALGAAVAALLLAAGHVI